MLKKILKTYGRHRADELKQALLALAPIELVQSLVALLTSGELRFRTRRHIRTASQLCKKFYQYDKKNPQVAGCYVQAAKSLREEQHRTRYSISYLTERIRWDIRMGIIKTEPFRIPNELRALYARLVVMREPSLCGLFDLKPSIADDLLVIDGRSWSEFAAEHHAELWPERKTPSRRKPSASAAAISAKAGRAA